MTYGALGLSKHCAKSYRVFHFNWWILNKEFVAVLPQHPSYKAELNLLYSNFTALSKTENKIFLMSSSSPSHISWMASRIVAWVRGLGRRAFILIFITFQMLSIGDKSGLILTNNLPCLKQECCAIKFHQRLPKLNKTGGLSVNFFKLRVTA